MTTLTHYIVGNTTQYRAPLPRVDKVFPVPVIPYNMYVIDIFQSLSYWILLMLDYIMFIGMSPQRP